MKYIIASDIHGSAFWCQKLLERWEQERADGLWLLGDILYHGPRNDLPDEYAPKKVIAMLNALKDKIVCVRGNCDAQVDQMVLEFSLTDDVKLLELTQEDAHIQKDLAVSKKSANRILLTHGHDVNKDTFLLPEIKERFSVPDCDFLIYGHFHVPVKTCVSGVWCLNPGSVSIPKECSAHSYMVYENGTFWWKDLDGNIYDSLVLHADVLYN